VPEKKKLKRAQVAGKTNLANYVPFLADLSERYPGKGPIVMGGHAVNHWVAFYRDRFEDPASYRTLLGKDLDCLIHPDVVAEEYMEDSDVYHQPAVFLTDLMFLTARRFLLRQRFTPLSPTFICRLGKVNVPLPGSNKVIHVDFFAHTVGYHPDYVRKRAVPVHLGAGIPTVLMMDPVQCLWQFISNAAHLNQTRGDNAPRRRTDHYRVCLLFIIVREYLLDLSEGKATASGNAPEQTLQAALDDLKSFLKRGESAVVGEQMGLNWSLLIPDAGPLVDGASQYARQVAKIRATQRRKPLSDEQLKARANPPTPGSLSKLPKMIVETSTRRF